MEESLHAMARHLQLDLFQQIQELFILELPRAVDVGEAHVDFTNAIGIGGGGDEMLVGEEGLEQRGAHVVPKVDLVRRRSHVQQRVGRVVPGQAQQVLFPFILRIFQCDGQLSVISATLSPESSVMCIAKCSQRLKEKLSEISDKKKQAMAISKINT